MTASGTIVSVSILGKADPEDPPALAGPFVGAFAGALDPAAGLFALEPPCSGVVDGLAPGVFVGELFP